MERRRGVTAMVALGPIQPNLIDGLKPWTGFQNVSPTCCAEVNYVFAQRPIAEVGDLKTGVK